MQTSSPEAVATAGPAFLVALTLRGAESGAAAHRAALNEDTRAGRRLATQLPEGRRASG
jgi:hypothetical protein